MNENRLDNIYCFSNVIRSTKTKEKMFAEVRQKTELGNRNLYLWKKTKEKEKS
jgi:hypothetical protein